MADELSDPNHSFSYHNDTFELSVCQPEHPNQAVFTGSIGIPLSRFRSILSESDLHLPETWIFMTREGSLISSGQEPCIHLSTITRRGLRSVLYLIDRSVQLTFITERWSNLRPFPFIYFIVVGNFKVEEVLRAEGNVSFSRYVDIRASAADRQAAKSGPARWLLTW